MNKALQNLNLHFENKQDSHFEQKMNELYSILKTYLINKSFLYQTNFTIDKELFNYLKVINFETIKGKSYIYAWFKQSNLDINEEHYNFSFIKSLSSLKDKEEIFTEHFIVLEIVYDEEDKVKDIVNILYKQEDIIHFLKLDKQDILDEETIKRYIKGGRKIDTGLIQYIEKYHCITEEDFLRIIKQNFHKDKLFKTLYVSYDQQLNYFYAKYYDLMERKMKETIFDRSFFEKYLC